MLWFSERSGWAHLYLYDLATGKLKNAVTQGNWLVRDIVSVDSKQREVFVQTAGRHSEWDPYYCDLCRINLDTGEINTLIASAHEYWVATQRNLGTMTATALGRDVGAACGVSPSGNFAVVTRSRADEAPSTLLLDRKAKIILDFEA